jgi:hypothetical protein
MTINQRVTQAINNLKIGSRLAMGLAVLSVVGVVGMTTTVTASAQTNTNTSHNNSFPTSKSDCANWHRFGNDFKNRGDCVSWLEHHTEHGNGYGGGGNGGGNGGLGNVIKQLFALISSLFAQLFAFLGHLF